MATEIDQLREKCKHVFIRERRAAIVRLGELMQDPNSREDARILIEDRAKNDEIQNIRILASSILDHYQRQNPTRLRSESQHIFAVSCPNCQNICYFDKRDVCGKVDLYRGPGGDGMDELYLKCTHCGKALKVFVDCEGYK